MSKFAMLVAILKTGVRFAKEEFLRNIDRYGVVGTFHKKSRGKHCRPGRVSRSERVKNALLTEPIARAKWAAQHTLTAASVEAMHMVGELRAARRTALEQVSASLFLEQWRNRKALSLYATV